MFNFFWRSLIEYVFRRRSVGASLIKTGLAIYIVILANLAIRIVIPTQNGPFFFSFDTTGGAAALSWGIFGVATAVIVLGAVLVVRDFRRENRKRVVVIEARGLRDWQGEPLEDAVPVSVVGRRDPFTIDVRQGLIDGQIVKPERALQRLSGLPDDVARRTDGLDRADISFVLGGLAPVPLLFLLGVIVDDEHQTIFMDWDRGQRFWRPLDEADDGRNFDIAGLDSLAGGTPRVALCVSASYDVLDADVRLVESSAPIIRMDLQNRSTASHWSEEKQRRLAQRFLDVVMTLSRRGVTEVSLFLAAPASLSLRLGTVYDKRNLPGLMVHQFEQAHPQKFPWAIRMPVAGLAEPHLEQR